MNTINQWLEGKKKPTTSIIHTSDIIPMSSTGLGLEQNKGYNECLDDLQAALPTLLSTMEAEIRERIGKKASHRDNPKHSKDEIYCCLECYKDEQINAERSRIHSIIKEYFTPRV